MSRPICDSSTSRSLPILCFQYLRPLICVSVLRIWVQAPASYLRFKAAESSHGVSLPTLPFRPVLERSSGDVGRFEALRRIFSTGAMLTAPQFEWAYHAFSDRLAISSGSGGTDICCCCERPFFPFLIRFHIIRSRVCYPFTSCLCGRDTRQGARHGRRDLR
jgi:hypothetical protein